MSGTSDLRRTWRDALADVRRVQLPSPHVLACLLHVASGALVLGLLPLAPGYAHEAAVALVGVLAIAAGVGIAMVPWHRFGDHAVRLLIPEALGLVVLFNIAADLPALYSPFLIVTWAWVGLTQPVGLATRAAPLLMVAYVAPAAFVDDAGALLSAGPFVIGVAVVLAETIALVASRMRRDQQALTSSRAHYESLIRHAQEFVIVVNGDDQIAFVNAAVNRVLGWDIEDLLGGSVSRLVHPADRTEVTEWFGARSSRPLEYRVAHADGTWRWIEATVTDLLDDPHVAGVVLNARDVSDRRAAQARLEHTAWTDGLTGLRNRVALGARLGDALTDAERATVALLFVDLDGFKVINDSLGHDVGDRVLVALTKRLEPLIGPDAELFRIGGDEFVVVIWSAVDERMAERRASALLPAFNLPFAIAGRQLRVTGSIGVAAAAPEDEVTADELLRRADLAMYRAKENGGAQAATYDAELARRAMRRLEIESSLAQAVRAGELALEFQPEVDLRTGRIVGAEALVRWDHPENGRIGPDDFIAIAEQSGLIRQVGTWVLDHALTEAARWDESGHPIPVSVNVSARQLRNISFVAEVASLLSMHGLDPSRLCLEITESALIEANAFDVVLPALHELGVTIAIDDFGTGYSSLAYLQDLAVDTLKIDRSFMPSGPVGHAPLIAAIVAMAHNLALNVVVEGVETPQQLALMTELGCDRAQGFFFARPQPPEVLLRMLRDGQTEPASLTV